MLAAVLLTFALFLVACAIHLVGTERAYRRLARGSSGRPVSLVIFLCALFALHFLAAAIFAGGFGLGRAAGLGDFSQEPVMGWMDYFYFSLINITTLGLGDIYPTGHLRFMAGIESLTGFLLISISASYVFKLVRRES